MSGWAAVPVELVQSDAPAVANLFARCADYFLLQDGVIPDLRDAVALFSDVPPEKTADEQTVLGWRDDHGLFVVAAILRDYPGDGISYLGLLLVDASRRGQGIGRFFYRSIEAWAAAQGAREMRLAVLEASEDAERFWRALGFDEMRRVGPDRFKERCHRRVELRRLRTGHLAGITSPRRPSTPRCPRHPRPAVRRSCRRSRRRAVPAPRPWRSGSR